MDTLTSRIGETLMLRGATAAIARWGFMRVAGVVGIVALMAYFLRGKKAAAAPLLLLPAPDASTHEAGSRWPGEDRRRSPELENGATYPGERRVLH